MIKEVFRRASLPVTFLVALVLMSILIDPILTLLGEDIKMNLNAKNLAPLESSNFLGLLGTDELGKNVLTLIIYASKYSLSISVVSGVLAMLIGILIGTLSGFWGDRGFRIKRGSFIATTIIVLTTGFYCYVSTQAYRGLGTALAIVVILILATIILLVIRRLLETFQWMNRPVNIPVDLVSMKVIEILFALPLYFILMALSALLKPSMLGLISIIALTSWPQTALLVRTEVLKVRNMDFISSLRLLGVKNLKIIFTHILPIATRPAIINMAFLASSLLIVESTLSFIGIGLPDEVISWGKILAQFKRNTSSWWIALFPGIITFITVLSLHRIGQAITDVQKKYV